MKFLVILLVFAFVGKISSAATAPRAVQRMDDDSAESDETADDEPVGESSEEVPEWSFREIPQESRWQQQQPNQVQQGGGHFGQQEQPTRVQQSIGNWWMGQRQGQSTFNNPIRRFRDDDSDEEEDDEDDDEDAFNDDVVDSDISYAPPESAYGVRTTGGFRAIGRGRANMEMTMTRQPMTQMTVTTRRRPTSSMPMMTRMPVYSRNRMPMYNSNSRIQMSNHRATTGSNYVQRRPSYTQGGQRQQSQGGSWVEFNPYRERETARYPVRRRTQQSTVHRGQYQQSQRRPGMVYNRPMVYDRRHMMPYRQSASYNYYNRRPMMTGYNEYEFIERV